MTVAGAGLAAPLLASCGSDAGSSGGAKTIGVSLNGLNEYTKYVAQGVAKAFEGGDYTLKVVQAGFDAQKELSNIEGLTAQAVDGMVVLPNTMDGVVAPIREATSSDIKVGLALWIEPGPLDDMVEGVAVIDSFKGGQMQGEWLKANAKPGKVIVVQGVLGQGFTEQLDAGLDDALQGSGFTVAVREQGFFDRNTAIDVVERALQAHSDATAIVTHAASMSDGVASYLKQNGIDNIPHIGDDADNELINTWLGTPYLGASRYYSAAETGLVAGKAVRAALEGGTPTFTNDCFQTTLTKENSAEVLQENPYSYPEFEGKIPGL